MTVSLLPELRQPPHDPLYLRLGGRLGWPLVGGDGPASLELPRLASSVRLLTEPSGSFGGLRTPAVVAVTDAGEVWLNDPDRGLLRLDRCTCTFEEVPCLPGAAGGIAFAAGHLFVCDPARQRVDVLLTPQLVLRGAWQAPMTWTPTGVAVDQRYRVHVADPLNGMVHHFGWSGRYRGNSPGVGSAEFVAAANDGSLFAAGPDGAYRIVDGTVSPVDPSAADVADLLGPASYEVAADGRMQLGVLCVPPTDGWFDLHGNAVPAPVRASEVYQRTSTSLVGPLDSLIDECVWHRVVLEGDLPAGCSVGLDTFTAQVPLSAAEVAGLPEQAWETRLTATTFDPDTWDGLVRGPAGRYLWLRLRLTGTGAATPRLDEALVEFPRISLRRFLPAVYGAEPTSADFTDRLLAIFDRSLRDVEQEVDDLPALFDPHATKALDWLASWIGITPDHRFPDALQRDIVADAGHVLDLRGTVGGLRRLLVVALGLDRAADWCEGPGRCPGGCARGCPPCPEPRQTCPPTPVVRRRWQPPPMILEHFRLRRWFEAGASTLGDTTVLWGESIVKRSQLDRSARVGATALKATQDPLRDPFHVYAHKFTVFVPGSAARTQERRRALEHLVAWASPAHTVGTVTYVDPRLRIGVQSSIGLDTVVARLPAGATLGETALGAASVIDDGDGPRPLAQQHLGTNTVLG